MTNLPYCVGCTFPSTGADQRIDTKIAKKKKFKKRDFKTCGAGAFFLIFFARFPLFSRRVGNSSLPTF